MAASPGPQQAPWPVMTAQAILKSASPELPMGTTTSVGLVSSQQTQQQPPHSVTPSDYNGCSYDSGVVGMPLLAQAALPTIQALPGISLLSQHVCLLTALQLQLLTSCSAHRWASRRLQRYYLRRFGHTWQIVSNLGSITRGRPRHATEPLLPCLLSTPGANPYCPEAGQRLHHSSCMRSWSGRGVLCG